MQAKKTGNCKKDVFVPILFLYLEKHLYKILIYNMLLYIKITFTRFRNKDQRNTFTNLKYRRPARSDGTKVRKFYQTKNGTPFGVPDMIRKQTTTLSGGRGSGRTRRRARSSVPARRGFAPYARRSRRRRRSPRRACPGKRCIAPA